jgi:phosphonate transport system substrate-binding protein
MVVLIALGLNCGNDPSYKEIDSTSRIALKPILGDSRKTRDSLIIAVASTLSARQSFVQYNCLMEYIAQKTRLPVRPLYVKKHADILRRFELGSIDAGFMCQALYIMGWKDSLFDPLVVPVVLGSKMCRAYIIVPAASIARSPEDLRGTRFAFVDELCFPGYFYPRYRIGEDKEFWKEAVFSGSHDNSILLINRGIVDGASVNDRIFEDVKKRHAADVVNVRIIEKSEPFANSPVVVARRMPVYKKRLLRNLFLSINRDSVGKECLKMLDIDSFEIANDDLYASVRARVPQNAEH